MATNQERLELINQRLDILNELNLKVDKIIELLTPKNNSQPLTTFVKANNVDDSEIKQYEQEVYKRLDNQK